MVTKPTLYGDYMSQPFRSCLLFCRVAGIDVDVREVQIAKQQHKQPEYLKINPLGKIPALKDGDLTLCQSPSIMRYLCDTQGMVADHWLPRDPRRRAQVNSALDWHLDNLRIGSMIVVWHRAVVLNLGQPGNERLVQDYGLPMLRNALKNLNDVWLGGKDFVGGGSQVSIADLLMACEIEMLRLLDAANQGPDFEELLAPHPQVRAWLARVAGVCSPHYQDVHSVLYKVRKAMLARKEKQQQQQQGTGSGSKL
ncbi:hypothetical protein N2152v2_005681 [Parachlorella kessleri]